MGSYTNEINFGGKQLVIWGNNATLDAAQKGQFFSSDSGDDHATTITSLELHDLVLQNGNANFGALSKLGIGYLELIDIQRKGKKFFIDKMPENYLYYKFIKTSLPLAKFIHVYRDPWDNAISLFKQNFVNEITYSTSFFGIALEYANYEHLMKKWKSEKNHNILDVSYQDLVTNTEDTVKKIWEFCNLPGKYEAVKRKEYFAQTASKQQVRQDIYASSLKKSEFTGYFEDFNQSLEEQRSYWRTT